MNAQRYYPTIVGSCLAMFAACVFAQAPATGTAAPAANTGAPATSAAPPATTAAGTSEQQPSTTTTAPAKMHHARKHAAMHSAHANQANTSPQDDAYRTALRQCVQGQESQRDQCLDDAISRYGRS